MDLIPAHECRSVLVAPGNISPEVNDFSLKVEGSLCWADD